MNEFDTLPNAPRARVISFQGFAGDFSMIEKLARAGTSIVLIEEKTAAARLGEIQSNIEAAGGISLALLPSPQTGRRIVDLFGRWDAAVVGKSAVESLREMLGGLEHKHWPGEVVIATDAPAVPLREERWGDATGRTYAIRFRHMKRGDTLV